MAIHAQPSPAGAGRGTHIGTWTRRARLTAGAGAALVGLGILVLAYIALTRPRADSAVSADHRRTAPVPRPPDARPGSAALPDAAGRVRYRLQPGTAVPPTGPALAVAAPPQTPPYSLSTERVDDETWRIVLTVDSVDMQSAAPHGAWRVILGEALGLAVAGHPPLPFVRHDLLLGAASEPTLEIAATTWETLPCPTLALSPGFVSRSAPATDLAPGGPGMFPAATAWLSPVYRLRGQRGVGLVLCPLRYDAEASALTICRRLEVVVRGTATSAEVDALAPAAARLAARRWPTQVKAPAKDGTALPPDERLLVLLPETWTASPHVAAFVQWKRQRGVRVAVQGLPAPVTAAAVRSQVAGSAAGGGAVSVLILGNENAVALGQLSPPSDTVYALLDGTADRYHDLCVSRLPAASAADLAGQLGRIVMYERWLWPQPTAGEWCGQASGVASNANQGNLGLRDREAMDRVRAELLAYGYAPCDSIYQYTGLPDPGTAPLVASWNSGRGLVLYLGHGLLQNWVTTGFSVATANQALRYGPSLPFVVSAACHTGNFSLPSDCLCEALLKAGSVTEPTGAIAAIGATSSMDWDPPVVMVQSFAGYLTQRPNFSAAGMVVDGVPARTRAGELAFDAVQRAVDFCLATPLEGDAAARRIVEQTHLFGDATLGVRTRAPLSLLVSHATEVARGTAFAVTARSAAAGAPMAGLTVCLCTPAGSQWLGSTDAAGRAEVAVPVAVSEATATLTLYAPDVIPYQVDLPIVSPVVPLVVVGDHLPRGRRGVAYSATLLATGGSGSGVRWSTPTALPAGLDLSNAGVLSGTPSEFGHWRLDLHVEDRALPTLEARVILDLDIDSAVYLALTQLPDGQGCQPYATDITALGSWPPFVFSPAASSTWPTWLTLSAAGRLTGTAPTPGIECLGLRVTDAAGNSADATLLLTVYSPPADSDADGQIDALELLASAARTQSACVAATAWQDALQLWAAGGAEAPVRAPGWTAAVAPQRRLGHPRYLPGERETVTIDLGLSDAATPLSAAVLTEVLPPGWQPGPAGARTAGGHVLPGPRRDGNAWSWFLDRDALRGGSVVISVRPSAPPDVPAVLDGWVTTLAGSAATLGSRLWWPRHEANLVLTLAPGWNLCALPLAVPAADLGTSFAPGSIRHCAPTGQVRGPAANIEPFAAYWVHALASTHLLVTGYEALSEAPAPGPGWTAGGVARTTAREELPGPPRVVWTWGPRGWEVATDDLLPGRGYLRFRP